jgi:hypothetical protein
LIASGEGRKGCGAISDEYFNEVDREVRRQQCLRFELQSVVTQATLTIQGYQTTPGDEGTRPLITTATNSTDLFTTSSNSGTQIWDNLQMTNTASTKATGIRQLSQHGTSQSWTVRNCVLSGFAEGLDSDNNGATYDVSWIHVIGTEISNCTIGCNTGNLVDNEQLQVSVSDTGVGLPPQQEDQIFNAFVTTKPHGTGMGLRISRSIIESHGGRLWATGASGRGATFQFTLPAATGGRLIKSQEHKRGRRPPE